MSSNPVFNRIDREIEQQGYAGFSNAPASNPQAGQWSAQQAAGSAMSAEQLNDLYNTPAASAVDTGRVTLDDVIMKTALLFGIVLVTGVAGWTIAAQSPGGGSVLALGGIVVTLVLGFIIARRQTISVPLIVGYAAIEGLMVGAISQFYEASWNGVVLQAVLATMATFAGMLLAYKTGLIKVTDKFRRIVTMAVFGYMIFAVVNLVYALVTNTGFGFGGTGMLGVGISLFAVGLAAVTLTLDFDSIDNAVAAGAPEKYSWLLAHGLIVGLVWLYLEMLRLLARLRE